jgi:hypothetical protein
MSEIILEKRYPHSRSEDITDAFMRGYLKGKADRPQGKWNFIGDNMFECPSCRVPYTTEQLNGLRNYASDPYLPKFCPNCGCDMRMKGADDE